MGSLLLGGRGRLTSAAQWRKVIELIREAYTAGAGLVSASSEIGICFRTLKPWHKAVIGDGVGHDLYQGSARRVLHKLSEKEHQRVLLICPGGIRLASARADRASFADQELYIGSESSFYQVLHAHG